MRHLSRLILAVAPLLLAATAPAAAQDAQNAIYAFYVVTYVDVQAASAKTGVALLKRYRDGARKESGNLDVELGQEIGRVNRFVLIEAWRNQADFNAHDTAAATARIRDALNAIRHSPVDRRFNTGFDVAPAAGKGQLMVETHIDVIPPRRGATEIALKTEAAATRQDAGNVRWDVFQQLAPQTNHFNVFALWRTRQDFARHETAAHRSQFRDTLAPLLGALYDERLYQPL
jgi:quinol monooxygenase YgiN